MKTTITLALCLLAGAPAWADDASGALPIPPRPEPAVQALASMVQACTGREAQALTQVATLQGRIAALEAQIAAENAKKPAEPASAH